MVETNNEPVVLEPQPEVLEVQSEVVVVEQPVELPELIYEYQPTDDQNRALGGKQVIKYKTQDELIQKITKQNIELVRLARDLKKKISSGEIDTDELPEDVVFASGNLQPRVLTPEERVQLSRDLIDPEKSANAAATLFESEIGAKPEEIRSRLQRIDLLEAKAEADAWVSSNPEYYRCQENFETITNWMVKNHLAPIRSNFQYTFDKLKAAGLLLEAPIVREEVPVTPVPKPVISEQTPVTSHPVEVEPARISSAEPSQARPVLKPSSGLTRTVSSDTGIVQTTSKLTLADINKMSSEDYKRRLKDPSFVKAVDELYAKPSKP